MGWGWGEGHEVVCYLGVQFIEALSLSLMWVFLFVCLVYVCMCGCMDGWMDGWMDDWMYVCIDHAARTCIIIEVFVPFDVFVNDCYHCKFKRYLPRC